MSGIYTAIAVGVTSLATGIYESQAAAGAQKDAAQAAANTQQNMFNQTNANQAPFRQTGIAAENALSSFYGLPGYPASNAAQTIQNLPGYQFQLSQGVQAIDRSQASHGLLNSGATGKALTQYGQGLAQNYAGAYTSGLQNLANLGEGATQATSQAGANAANQISSDQIYAGQAQASGDINTYNALSSSLSQGIGLYGLATRGQQTPPIQLPQSQQTPAATGYGFGGNQPIPGNSIWSYPNIVSGP